MNQQSLMQLSSWIVFMNRLSRRHKW